MPKRTRLPKGGVSARRQRLAEVMSGRDIHSEFNRWQKDHPNFMTPTVISTTARGNKIVELSTGTGFLTEKPIYGVTAIERIGKNDFKTLVDLKVMGKKANDVFDDKAKAEKHVAFILKHLEMMK